MTLTNEVRRTDRQVYGPEDLGGRPDGMTFDAFGNLWITVYIGSLLGTTLPTFRSPVPGQPMIHWTEPF
jgi:sugar lactone lactonase YvrE